jgi:hypothetical protein
VLLYGGADTGLTALQLLGPFVSVAAASARPLMLLLLQQRWPLARAAESQQRSLRPWGRILGTLH